MENHLKSTEIQIVKAREADAKRITDFYNDLIHEMINLPHSPKWIQGVYPSYDDIRELCMQEAFFLAVQNDRICGAVAVVNRGEQSHAHVSWKFNALTQEISTIHLLAVAPAVQCKGLGYRLMRIAEDICRKRGDKVIRLDTLPESIPANKLYQKCGFSLVATDTRFYDGFGRIAFHYYELPL